MLHLGQADLRAVSALLAGFGLDLRLTDPGADIPGSYWGESEAGLQGNTLLARLDTPVHSVLHETAHYICMSPERRVALDRDAGGDDAEECAVCYLQILLADELPMGRDRMLADMDAWGYTFRLGSARGWFERDASDARAWLAREGLVDSAGRPSFRIRFEQLPIRRV